MKSLLRLLLLAFLLSGGPLARAARRSSFHCGRSAVKPQLSVTHSTRIGPDGRARGVRSTAGLIMLPLRTNRVGQV